MFDKLMPKDDVKQRIRMKRALQALGGGCEPVAGICYFVFFRGFRLDLQGFILLMIFLWVGHLTIPILIRLDINRHFSDPSMTREMVNWAIFTLLVTVFFMDHYRSLMLMYFPIILLYGALQHDPEPI